jgi:D-cysteine desulfhydrase
MASVLGRFPRIPLGSFPSPVRCGKLASGGRFWIKDDGGCSEVYGGNKLRKLEYLLAEVRRLGQKVLVVHGDVESHTVRACCLLAPQVGLDVHAVVFPHRGQVMDGTDLAELSRAGVRIHRRASMLGAIGHARWLGWRLGAVVVPLGASTPTATLGYVGAAVELMEQVRQGLLPEPRRIYIPFATGGSVAGLMIGLALTGGQTRVVAVQAVDRVIANCGRLERLVKQTLSLPGFDRSMFGQCMRRLEMIDRRYLGRGYRDIPCATQSAVELAAHHGLSLEPAFSGKAFAGMLDALPEFPDGELLYWNTHDQSDGPTPIESI